MNMKLGALGQGNRANATIGRAVRLAVRNVGGARPGGTERSTLGSPMKFTMCFRRVGGAQPVGAVYTWSAASRERFRGLGVYACERADADCRSGFAHRRRSWPARWVCAGVGFNPRAHTATDTLLVVCPNTSTPYGGRRLHQGRSARAHPGGNGAARSRACCGRRLGHRRQKEMAEHDDRRALDRQLPKFRKDEDITLSWRARRLESSLAPSTAGLPARLAQSVSRKIREFLVNVTRSMYDTFSTRRRAGPG